MHLKLKTRYIAAIAVALCAIFAPARSAAQINADQVMRVGQNALYFEDYMLSIQYFNLAIEAKPYLAKPWFFRAVAKLNLDDFKGAEADADHAIELNPFLTDAYEVRGVARQNLGRPAEAIVDYDNALSRLPDNRQLLFNKALAQEECKDFDGAMATYNRIIEVSPGYDNAYVGRAKLYMAMGDSISALPDLDRAIELNKNSSNAYVLRSAIEMDCHHDYRSALADMDEAINLQPRFAGYFINRAFLRYNLDDFRGAMADYDYAITIDPLNPVAYFNRGLLRAEVSDNVKAIDDFTSVLKFDPGDIRALYNRSLLYRLAGEYDAALADINRVIDALPDYSAPLFARFEIYEAAGKRSKAIADYDRAVEISKKEIAEYHAKKAGERSGTPLSASTPDVVTAPHDASSTPAGKADQIDDTDTTRLFANRFSTLLTIDNQLDETREYNNRNIRGKVQDRDVVIEIEPDFAASYYSSPTELSPSTYYMQEIDRLNEGLQLSHMLQITNTEPDLSDEALIREHFASIDKYNRLIAQGSARPIDYFGRAMDQYTLHNYPAAIEDLTRAINLSPDFTLAWFMRAQARSRNIASAIDSDDHMGVESLRAAYMQIIDDYDRAIELSPRLAFAWFNKGNLYEKMQDLTSAISCYTRAIELKPDFGEAFYNRGYVYFRLGNRDAGASDLSRAGQLGILPSYNLLKRMLK